MAIVPLNVRGDSGDLYISKYGARVGDGPCVGYLGDPSKFDFELVDGCNYFYPGYDRWGNSGLILIRAKDKEIYDWQAIAQRDSKGFFEAQALFERIENATVAGARGIGGNFASDTQHLISLGVPEVMLVQSDLKIIPNPDKNALQSGFDRFTGAESQKEILGRDSRVAVPSKDWRYNRLYTAMKIGAAYPLVTFNPTLRIGYITGFGGEICGGDCAALPVAEEIGALAAIVIGFVTGQQQFVSLGLNATIQIWTNYVGQLAALKKRAAQGDALSKEAYQLGGCSIIGTSPAPDWIDTVKGWF